jgi:O-antigen/teichoic acid export membrane protein
MDNYFKKGASKTAFLFIAIMLANLCGYFVRAVLTRSLSPSDFGLFYAVQTFFYFVVVFTDIGFGKAVVKYVAHFLALKRFKKLYSYFAVAAIVQICLGIILSVGVLFCARFLAAKYFHTEAALPLIWLVPIAIMIWVVWGLMSQMFTAYQKIYTTGLLQLSFKGIFLLAVLWFVFFTGLRGAIMPMYAHIIALCGIILFVKPIREVFSNFTFKLEIAKKPFVEMARFALPTLLNSFGMMIVGYVDVMMLTYFRTLAEVGVYNVVLPTALIMAHLGTSVSIVLFPMVSELWAKKSISRLKDGLRLLYNYSPFFVLPGAIVMMLYPEMIISVLFGKAYSAGSMAVVLFGREYLSGPLALQILAFGVATSSLFQINASVLAGIGKPMDITWALFPAALFNFLANLYAIPHFGIVGAAFTTSISLIIMMVISTHRVKRYIHNKLPWLSWLKTICAASGFVAVVLIMRLLLHIHPYARTIIGVAVAGIFYLALGFALRIVDINHIEQFYPVKKFFRRVFGG